MGKIKVLLVDDHSMVREGIKQLLELDGDIKVIGEAGDGKKCLELIKKLNPDVVLLDIDMPVMGGLQVLEKLHEMGSKQKVLILTIHNEVEYLFRAMEIGAEGYVLKDSESSVLKSAIYAIYDGETYMDASLTPLLKEKKYIKELQREVRRKEKALSAREIEVLCFLAEGLYNKEIAVLLKISEKTVKNHVSNIFKKIGVADRTQAAVYAIKHNFVELK
ncbi:MAG: response regulator transcription factor [Lachnospiraceae bacterium]|nr:response regulator transcription factor [Lachnospiraceae bacterium]